MNARYNLYNDMKAALGNLLPEVKHVGLWNQDVDYMDESVPWLRPAVFIEFCPIAWDTVLKGYPLTVRGTGDVKLHVVTDWNDEKDYEGALQLSEKVAGVLMYICDIKNGYGVLQPGQTITNHNHESILENIEVLRVKWQQVYAAVDGL